MGRGLVISWMVAASAWAQLPKSQLDLQRESARTLEPAEIILRQIDAPRGEPRVLKVRVYAARDYRAQTFDWSSRFNRLMARVNRVLGRWPNLRLEVTEVRRWEHDSAVPLEKLLGELEAADPGRDVDFVVGLAVAVPTFPEQLHNLGMARQMGRHFVVRSLHDLAEYELVRGAFDQMSPPERERLMGLRKAHKEVVVFLHELAHTLGLIHAQRWNRVMNSTYNHGQSELSSTEGRMFELGLDKRGDAAAWRPALLEIVQREPDGEWDPRDRDQLRALLSSPTPASAADEDDAAGHLQSADGLIRAHLDARADDELAEAERRLASHGTAEGWKRASELRRRLEEPTLAVEDARKAGGDTHDVEAWAAEARRRWLLPAGALPPSREGEYVRLVQVALQALADGRKGVAEMLARQIGDTFPDLPASAYLRKELAKRQR